MKIRRATMQDLVELMNLYRHAQNFMREHGNPTQWGTQYPSKEQIIEDISSGYLCICEEECELLAAFFFAPGPDACYQDIQDGQWLENDTSYWVIHRVASYGKRKGIAAECLNWCWEQHNNLRIDTHRNNIPMQNLLKKCGFVFCGIIHLANGDERLAFQKVLST